MIRKNVVVSCMFFLLMSYSFRTVSSAYHLFIRSNSEYRCDCHRKLDLEQAVTGPEVKITDKIVHSAETKRLILNLKSSWM